MTEENYSKKMLALIQQMQEQQGHHPDYQTLGPNYEALAIEWCQRDIWTVDECANLFAGTSPTRPISMPGAAHDELNRKVMQLRNTIASCVGVSLILVSKKRLNKGANQFEKGDIIAWAESKTIDVPEALVRAANASANKLKIWQYSTPLLEALQWVVEHYWEGNADYSTVPRQQQMVETLMKRFDLSKNEAVAIDRITRHPTEKQLKKKQ